MNLIDIYRIFHTKRAEYMIFSTHQYSSGQRNCQVTAEVIILRRLKSYQTSFHNGIKIKITKKNLENIQIRGNVTTF